MDDATESARQLTLLGILLQCLHVLFGVTAIIGVLIAHSKQPSTTGTVYHSQLRWQIITFWFGLLAYAVSSYLWITQSITWPAALAFAFVLYRLITSVVFWQQARPLERLI